MPLSRLTRPALRALRRSGRTLITVAAGVAVIAGMLAIAAGARAEADDARRAQVLLERLGAYSNGLDAATWRGIASDEAQASLEEGLAAERGISASLRSLQHLGIAPDRLHRIEERIAEVRRLGWDTWFALRTDKERSRRLAAGEVSPAIDRLAAVVGEEARAQSELAAAAQRRQSLAGSGSLLGGLALLALLGARMHRVRRSALLAERVRDAERRGEERLRALVRHSTDVVALIDPSSRVLWIAESVEGMLGYRAEDLVGRRLIEFVHDDETARAARALEAAAANAGAGPGTLSVRVRVAGGGWRQIEVIADNHLADPDLAGILLNLRDVSERVALEDRLRHQAFHDSLTGLPNRALFEDRLGHALDRMRRVSARAALVYLDLDDFKTVNDSLGHVVGDELLKTTSARLRHVLRAQDTAARLGGDEFAVLLEDLDDEDEAVAIAERLRAAVQAPVMLAGRRLTPSASFGIAQLDGSASATELLGNADVAMYAAKERGKGQVASFEPSMRERVVERMTLTADLANAVERDELVLEYQPVVELDSGATVGVEALIRWMHPARGRLAPDRFIGLAESSGLIVPIGRWVLETACAQLRRWDDERPDGPPLEMSVNVSTRQLADPAFPDLVRTTLQAEGIEPERLTLEITEHLLLDDSAVMRERLEELKAVGVRLAVDDFGTGYSALSYLQAFPIDVLKVDRSFISGIATDVEKAGLVKGIIEMGLNLSLQVIAEGIEESDEAELLRGFRSRYGQGFLFSRPVDAAAIALLLERGTDALTA